MQSSATPPPVSPSEPIKLRSALRGVWLTLGLGALFVAGAALVGDTPTVVGAGIAVAVVSGTLLLTGAAMSFAARFGPAALMAAALGGYVLKLCIYAVLIVLLADSDAIDGSSLAVTSAILLVAALVWQTRWALRDARLFWVTTSGHASASRSTHDVVYTSGWRSSHRSSDPRSTERTPG